MARGAIIYPTMYESASLFGDEVKLNFLDAAIRYQLYGEIIDDMKPEVQALFVMAKPNLDSAQNRYNAAVENGKKGGRPKKAESKPQRKPEIKPVKNETEKQSHNHDINTDIDIDTDINTDIENNNDIKRKPLPIQEEVKERNHYDPEEAEKLLEIRLAKYHQSGGA